MTLKKLQTMQSVLDKMSKPEIVLLAREYNKYVKIPELHKKKKQELKVELLSNYEIVHDIWSGKKVVKLTKNKKREVKKLDKKTADNMIKKSIELKEKAMTADVGEKSKLLKEAEAIDRKVLKGL